MSSLEKAKLEVARENPNMPMQLKFEVSPAETIEKLLKLKYIKLNSFKNGWYKQDFFLWEKDINT